MKFTTFEVLTITLVGDISFSYFTSTVLTSDQQNRFSPTLHITQNRISKVMIAERRVFFTMTFSVPLPRLVPSHLRSNLSNISPKV